ncbi:EAL domain-containing protein [Kineosporia sp. NBRC 101677]|uniref:EAL domain-containing protein n=1 Tax=Kineosporia sp. NBRC 101677 TaxID=3032197 RepID=UPI0025543889|nr:EAL domain-containing protein [Kineosporia sp. NBRC 101677]
MPSSSVPSARRGAMVTDDGPCLRPIQPQQFPGGLHAASAEAARRLQQAAVRRIVTTGGPEIVFQPQLSLSRMTVEGYEALARFPETPFQGPENWFNRAHELGLGVELEVSAVQRALGRLRERPADTTVAVNVSPAVLISPALSAVLPSDLHGVEIELTEHEWRTGAAALRRRLDHLRERGARVAIDDVGAAHSGLRRVMDLAPDKLKLDRALVQGVANSSAKAALVRAVVDLAEQIGATVCAEGVENLDDLEAVADLDVACAQGWAVGMPAGHFAEAEPSAVRSAQDRLAVMLRGGPPRSLRCAATPATGDIAAPLSGTSGAHAPAPGAPEVRPPATGAATSPTSAAAARADLVLDAEPTKPTKPIEPTEPVAQPVKQPAPLLPPDRLVHDVDDLLTHLTTVTGLPELHTLVSGCAAVLGAETLVLSVLSADGTTLSSAPTRSRPSAYGESFPLAGFPLTRDCLEGRSVVPVYREPSAVTDPGEQAERGLLQLLGFQTVLMVPVISRDRVIGLLECFRPDLAPWSRRQIRSARTVAAMLGPVLDGLLPS